MVLPIDPIHVAVTLDTPLPVSAARVWALVRDFDAMPAWNASVRRSCIEDGPADRVGCRRVLVFDDGGTWTHQLTGLSDADMKLQYRIVATPQPMRIPVWNYRAEIRVIAGSPPGARWRSGALPGSMGRLVRHRVSRRDANARTTGLSTGF